MVLAVYHYLNVCYYRRPMLNKNKNLVRIHYIIPYKTEVATDVTDVKMLLILIMNINVTATQATIKCVFLRDKKVILLSFIL